MQDFEKLGTFYLGRVFDPVSRRPEDELLLYDSRDLVTHAVVVGMTGSGKTGLCIGLLEEAAIDRVPAIAIDPKGDLGNIALQFPELRPEDFAPWVSGEDAGRENISVDELASRQAALWREGLAKWGQDGARIRRLREAAEVTIYTPGSSAGVPLSMLKSFAAPPASLVEDREAFRDRISVTATAVLSLLGIEADPIKSREHILISGNLEKAWRDGKALDIAALIQQIQKPPTDRVGVLDLEAFYPAKERFELATSLNNLLASPGFEAWLEGEPLDIDRLLRTPEGKPRISVISIAHLGDADRMFVVSMLFNEILSWTRRQSGTTSLRAIVYMDEIFGYFPPSANPPSKRPLLTLVKQARAFGVGIVLATQNPVDLDYKGLANAGTWFIGRLQTERDKLRLIEGLEGVAGESGAKWDRARMDQILAGLGKRVFLMNNVHESEPVCFETRWTLSYLRGPLTRAQIKTLMSGRMPPPAPPSPAVSDGMRAEPAATNARPVLPPEVPQAWIPVRGNGAGIVYRPQLLAAVQMRFTDAKTKVDAAKDAVYMTPVRDEALPVQWEEAVEADVDPDSLEKEGVAGASYAPLPPPATKARNYQKWNKDAINWIYSQQQLVIYRSPSTKLCSNPGESEAAFRARIDQRAREDRDAAAEKLRQKYAPKLLTLQDRLRRAQHALERQQEQAREAGWSTAVAVGTSVLGALLGSRRKVITRTNLGAAGRIHRERQDVGRAEEDVAAIEQQLRDLEAEVKAKTEELQTKIDAATDPLETITIKPKKTNIAVRLLTLAWAPYRGGEPAW
ncbi:MAG TPA: hypothetical protein VFL57_12755 [Bryobacteraceae bacterium]|nr:hypothetical protein [Bryobacteraceae bacterium]